MSVRTIAVLGAGQMGAGIAQVAAAAGYDVVMRDIEDRFVLGGLSKIQGRLQRAVSKGELDAAAQEAIRSRIRGTLDMAAAAKADLVIEAVPEEPELKKSVLREMDRMAAPQTILASNTSSISIGELAAATRRPDRFVGMHFFNPVPVMKLVEVVQGKATSPETLRIALEVCIRMGKTPVEVHDFPGFVSNRVLMPMINEAILALQDGVATKEAIDTVMKLGANHPMGPLELADFIGLDTCLNILEVLERGFASNKYAPAPLLRRMVSEGKLGKKSGHGFYEYA
ncbi:MAG TPA: 3-hydroxybutyryl-CoA dehydrogenase [Thermoplasmata archaeon]|nr:3-hydroxybutyryl-CoA dehydrogenase [Thermoplasmata archaeon]